MNALNDLRLKALNVESLLKDRFGSLAPAPLSSGRGDPNSHDRTQRIARYRAELEALPNEEIARLVQESADRKQRAAQQKAELEEAKRPFTWPATPADYEYWSKQPYWQIDEALALSFGKSPNHVRWETISKSQGVSPFARLYAARRDLVQRFIACNQLTNPVWPSVFLRWAERLGEAVPDELITNVKARGVVIADWKDLYDSQKAIADGLTAKLDALGMKSRELQAALSAAKDAGESLAAQAVVSSKDAPRWPAHDTEKMKILRLAAVKHWSNYDPTDPTSAPTNEVVIDWLMTQHQKSISKTLAEAMATILRADGLKKGPRSN